MALTEDQCAAIVYAETASLRKGTSDASVLHDARVWVAKIAYKRDGKGVAAGKTPGTEELKWSPAKTAWDDCKKAAKEAKGENAGTCRHFVIWPSDDNGKTPTAKPSMGATWPYTEKSKITHGFGPLSNPVKVGDTPKSDKVYIFVYCGVA